MNWTRVEHYLYLKRNNRIVSKAQIQEPADAGHVPELKDEQEIWTPGLDLSANFTGRSLHAKYNGFIFPSLFNTKKFPAAQQVEVKLILNPLIL